MFKLLALDIDGTLLNSQHELTPRTEQALHTAMAQGLLVVLATGKQYISIGWLVERLGLTSPQITSHGALITDPQTGNPLYLEGIPADLAAQAFAIGKEMGVTMVVNGGGMTFATQFNRDIEYMLTYGDPVPAILPDLTLALDPLPTHLTMLAYQNEALYLQAEARFRAALEPQLAIYRSSPFYLEFLHPHASKGHALQHVCEMLGVSLAETVAIGDSYNDVSMFEVAGLAVAMGHAPDGVKEKAQRITGTNNEDGAAVIIEELCRPNAS